MSPSSPPVWVPPGKSSPEVAPSLPLKTSCASRCSKPGIASASSSPRRRAPAPLAHRGRGQAGDGQVLRAGPRHAGAAALLAVLAAVATSHAFTPPPKHVTTPKMRHGATKLRAGATDLSSTQRTALLGSLIGVYTSNQWCRQLLFSTVDFTSDDAFRFLNVGLELSRADYALLSTLTFNALFAACSLAAGALVDRADAVKLTYVSCGLWALATVATAYTSSFAGVAACRALQGVAMAATAPAGYALLGRAFPPDKLATASSRYAAAVRTMFRRCGVVISQ